MLAYALVSKPCSEATNIGYRFSSRAVFGCCSLNELNSNLTNFFFGDIIVKEFVKIVGGMKMAQKLKEENYPVRILVYILGLFIMTLGISMSVKSDLGVSPVSSIPYSITCITGLEMGKATILFHIALVLLQIILLGRAFKLKNLLQVVVGIIFGYFTTFSNYLFSFLPTPHNILIRLILMLGSAVFIAVGIFFYLPADIIPLAGEGAMQAVSIKTHILFNKVKIGFDVSMVTISLIACLLTLGRLGSVGVGTIIAAVLVGTVLGFVTRLFGVKRDAILYPKGRTSK